MLESDLGATLVQRWPFEFYLCHFLAVHLWARSTEKTGKNPWPSELGGGGGGGMGQAHCALFNLSFIPLLFIYSLQLPPIIHAML